MRPFRGLESVVFQRFAMQYLMQIIRFAWRETIKPQNYKCPCVSLLYLASSFPVFQSSLIKIHYNNVRVIVQKNKR
jgi:hypothetical protein